MATYGIEAPKGLTAPVMRFLQTEHLNAIHSVRKEINRLSLEQAQALQEATFMGMTPDEAKESDARLDKIVKLINVLEQLESTVPRLN